MNNAAENVQLEDLRTVRQLVEEHPQIFTVGGLRWLIFNEKTNGFSDCIVRVGRKVLIDTRALKEWLSERRGVAFGPAPAPAPERLQRRSRRRPA